MLPADKKGRIGTIMVTPPKLPAKDSLPPLMRFQDRPGACKLIETAVSRGDQSMAQRRAECRAN